jgi:hypothetical protein
MEYVESKVALNWKPLMEILHNLMNQKNKEHPREPLVSRYQKKRAIHDDRILPLGSRGWIKSSKANVQKKTYILKQAESLFYVLIHLNIEWNETRENP